MDVREAVVQLLSMDSGSLDFRTAGYQRAINLAQTIISELDADEEKKELIEPRAFSRLLILVQKLAFLDPDHGPEPFFAGWCERQWASKLQLNPYDAESQIGLARSWLLKAQPSLARIEQLEYSNHSTHSSSSSSGSANSPRAMRRNIAESDRINSPNYVAARDMLRPAVEHVDQALSIMHRSGTLMGDVLELAAEAYIHFGNVSHPQNNEICYQRALRCLLLVSGMSDFDMDVHLREFFEANVDYITEENPAWYALVEVSV